MRLRAKLALGLTAMLAVLVLAMAWLSWLGVRDEIRAGVAKQLFSLVSYAAQGMDNDLRLATDTVRAVAQSVPAEAVGSPAALARHMGRLPMPMGGFERCIAIAPDGRPLAQQPEQPPIGNQSFAGREYFRRAMAERQAVISRPFLGTISHLPVVAIAVPRIGTDGAVELVLQCSFSLDHERIFGEVQSARIGRSGYLYVATREGQILLHPDRARILAEATSGGANAPAGKAGDGFEGTEEGENSAGVRALMSVRQLRAANWFVAAVYPLEEAYAPLREAGRRVILINVLVLLACAACAWLLAGLLVRPLERLTRHVGVLRERPQTVVHQLPLRNDEIGALAMSFNGLLAELRERENSLRASEEKFGKVFHTSPDAIVITRLEDGVVIDANEGFEQLTGFSVAEATGHSLIRSLNVWVCPQQREEFVALLRARGWVSAFGHDIRRKDGEIRHCSVSSVSIHLGGESCLISIVRDITQQQLDQLVLKASEERFAKAFNANPNYATISRLEDGRFVAVNQGFERLTGWKAQEVLGRTALEIDLWAEPAERQELVRRLRSDGEWKGFKVDFRKKSGELVLIEGSCVLTEIAGEQHIIGIARDITEVQRAEDALRQSEEKFTKAFHAIPDFVSITRLRDGLVLDVNEGFEKLTGYTAAEIVGRSFVDIGLWADPVERAEMVSRIMRDGAEHDAVHHFRTRSGEVRTVLGSAVRIDIGGEPCLIAIARDITGQLRTQEALRLSEEKFSKVFHASPDAILITRPQDGRVIEANESFCQLTGYGPDEVLGGSLAGTLHIWNDPALRLRFIAILKERGQVSGFEHDIRRKDGELRHCMVSAVAIDIGGAPCLISIVRDVTELRRAEEEIRNINVALEHRVQERTAKLEETVREMESFSYSISHDLRAPLRAIAGYAKIIDEDYAAQFDAEGRRLLERIAGGAVRMGELIDDLLDFARIGRAELKRAPIDMAGLAREVLAELPEAAGGRQLEVRIGAMPMANADRSLVRQIWANLLSNALKYTRRCDAALIEAGGREERGEAHYFVRDNGAGFDMAYADKLFRVFQRLHREADFEGTGVGLAIVARIVERHGGRVWAESAPGQGATFHFTLPLAS